MPWKKKIGMPKVERETHELDAAGKPVGRLATQIATLLIGKHKASIVPNIDAGDIVKVSNVDKIVFTGKKWEQKVHYRTSNRPGGLKMTPMSKLREENPAEILKHAVKYMLPKNRQQVDRMKRLIFVK
ncbi:MAG: 50S ribosomal protein L13 [Patescibacteria group bacterium]|nr:50S ribosomal protein L13 [Patescibacteria group bacterium]